MRKNDSYVQPECTMLELELDGAILAMSGTEFQGYGYGGEIFPTDQQ